MNKYPTKPNITPEMFVIEWQKAKTLQDFCDKTGLGKENARSRARSYRKKGIQLKSMVQYRHYDVDALKKLVQK